MSSNQKIGDDAIPSFVFSKSEPAIGRLQCCLESQCGVFYANLAHGGHGFFFLVAVSCHNLSPHYLACDDGTFLQASLQGGSRSGTKYRVRFENFKLTHYLFSVCIYRLYLNNTQYINNWDLVDSSAYHIVGTYLEDRGKKILYKLTQSNSLWERRIAIMSTFQFIRKHQFGDTLSLSEQLIDDKEDLIHKAVGWMLREIGKRDLAIEKAFLKKYYKKMPRTMLRYAIEKFPEQERKEYLKGVV